MSDIYREMSDAVAKRERAVLITLVSTRGSVPRRAGAKMLIREDGTFVGTVGGGSVEHSIKQKAMELMKAAEPQLLHFDLSGREPGGMICGGQVDAFFEPLVYPETIYLCGAGHIAQATAAMAAILGFEVVVIDKRTEYNNRERFPSAGQLVTEEFAEAFSRLDVDETGYIIIYTWAHTMDEESLRLALGTRAGYIGMIGSKKKVKEIEERLLAKGITRAQMDRAHAPIGIEIGAETPGEIAVSILAEIIKVKRQKPVKV